MIQTVCVKDVTEDIVRAVMNFMNGQIVKCDLKMQIVYQILFYM